MRKILNSFIVFSVVATFTIFSVLCCCTASAVMAHFHQKVMCGHCEDKNSNSHPCNSSASCQHQFSSAEILHGQTIVSSQLLLGHFYVSVFLNHHRTFFPSTLSAVDPPGSPPRLSFTPLYLRTFNLRI